MTIEKVICRLIEFYHRAKREKKKNPVAWAVHQTDKWMSHWMKDHNGVEGGSQNDKDRV